MPLFLVLNAAGDVVRESTSEADLTAAGLRPGEVWHTLSALNAPPDRSKFTWNAATKQYDALPPAPPAGPPPSVMTVLNFKARFTAAERDRLDMAEIAHPDLIVRARLKRLREDLADCRDKVMDRADPRTQKGVAYLTTVIYDGAPLLANMARAIEIIGADVFNPANLV